MDPELILQHVAYQLCACSPKEVLLLREIISSMTSIEMPVELNDSQILAYAGGPILATELVSQATRGSRALELRSGNRDGQARLIKSLISGRQLAWPVLIALARYRKLCTSRAGDGQWHPRYLSGVYDDVSQTAYYRRLC